MVRPTVPGRDMEVDFGYLGITYDDETRRNRKTYLFSGRLRHSRLAWREAGFRQNAPAFFMGHIHAFVHDFPLPEKGKAIPCGVYDLTRNAGWVSVGIDHDTASFATRTILRWWRKMGQPVYPGARRLWSPRTRAAATARGSACGSGRFNGWQTEWACRSPCVTFLLEPASGTGLNTALFSYISTNWRGQSLVGLAVIVSLIASTRTAAGLRVRAELDKRAYPAGVEVAGELISTIKLQPHRFHGDWNYTIDPRRTTG